MKEFNYKKKYGQNFLKNKRIVEDIITAINPTSKDLIVEIGAGKGAITKGLKRYNAKLISFEIDEDTKPYLEKIEDDKTNIIYEDFLTCNLMDILNNYSYEDIYIIGNLPYYITTPIISKIIDSKISPKKMVLMVQKEVGERFMAKPHTKQYGYITALLDYWFDIFKVVDVPKEDFVPSPNVDSVVLSFSSKKILETDYEKLTTLLKDAFKFKRKNLKNNLKQYNLNKIDDVLYKHNFTLNSRAEDIPIYVFVEINNSLNN